MDEIKKDIIDASLSAECDISDILVSGMLFFNHDQEFIYKTLKTIQYLLVLEENTMDLEIENNPYFFKNKLERNGIDAILRKYENTDSYDLYQLVETLNEEFFPTQS